MIGKKITLLERFKTFQSRREYLVASLPILIFSLLALGNATRWSIWFDEAFSAYLMRFNLPELTHFTAVDVHPPLYYWILKVWTTLLGSSELAFRSLSILMAVVALIGAYLLVRRLFNRQAAFVALTLAALSPLLLRFADEARMYTMVTAIVIWATWLLLRLQTRSTRLGWLLYGLLLAAGMYTHYFAAFAWLGHWVWRYLEKRAGTIKRFWTSQWFWVHVGAVLLYLPWIPAAFYQFSSVQNGFWIPPLSVYSPIDYLSNSWLYLEYGAAQNWWTLLFWSTVILVATVIVRAGSRLNKGQRPGYRLLAVMSLVPVLIMALFSLPPLKSSFLDRYVLPSAVFLLLLVGVGLYIMWNKQRRLVLVTSVAMAATLLSGISQVYYYGNYNKNTNLSIRVKEVVGQINSHAAAGQPIIASSPWTYYEAAFYDNSHHPVYFLDASTKYEYGSLAMLKESDDGKITNLEAFSAQHRYVWYLDWQREAEHLTPPDTSWQRIDSVEAYDYISDSTVYRAELYDTRPNAE